MNKNSHATTGEGAWGCKLFFGGERVSESFTTLTTSILRLETMQTFDCLGGGCP
jgi:hypothetical protein